MSVLLNLYIVFITLVFIGIFLIDFVPYFRKRKEEKYEANYAPKALVIVPCRGVDLNLAENLKSISSQDYKNYAVVGVVDNAKDPAAKYIRKAGMKLLISNYKGGMASGKVAAILSAIKKFDEYTVYVIADSDILVQKDWLANIVRPLANGKVGISTMYPRFIPVAGFWSKAKYVWGFVGEGLMEHKLTRFGWGGSLAFRKDLIDKNAIAMLSNSKYSVSDDICLTKIAKENGLSVAYVKEPRPKVKSDDNFGRFFEWSSRQTALSVLGYRSNLYYGICFYSAETLLFISGIVMSLMISPIFLIFLLHFIKSEIKTYVRAQTADPTIAVVVIFIPIIYLVNLLLASRTKYITWRGRVYRLRN